VSQLLDKVNAPGLPNDDLVVSRFISGAMQELHGARDSRKPGNFRIFGIISESKKQEAAG